MNSCKVLCSFLIGLIVFSGHVVAQTSPVSTSNEAPRSARGIESDRYNIGYEDVLQVSVYKHPELSQTVRVARDGTIIMPKIDEPIVAVCKTERELASAITAFYRNYLRNPFVNVRAIETRSQPIAVVGAVNKPGGLYLNRKVRLLEVLALAGGPDYEQSGAFVQVTRIGSLSSCEANEEEQDKREFFRYLLGDVMSGKNNPFVQPGDIVGVMEAKEAYVIGNVVEPTTIKLKDPITLTQAIAKAGGLGPNAKTSRVIIERRNSSNKVKSRMTFDLKAIRAQTTEDPEIEANDIIVVDTSTPKAIRNGIIRVFTQSIPNLVWRFPL